MTTLVWPFHDVGVHLMLAHKLAESEVYGVPLKDGPVGLHRRLHSKSSSSTESQELNKLHDELATTAETEVTAPEPEKTKEVSRWADSAMYRSEPLKAANGPQVTLLNATPDPLGSLAALSAMYKGEVVRTLNAVTDPERRQALTDMLATELQGPLESIVFHFLIEGVTRSWTHQAVRERQAFFAQESMRFAVVEGQDWTDRVALPPSLAGTTGTEPLGAEDSKEEYARNVWDESVMQAEQAYLHLINSGVPAEDARGIMPHAMTTRLHVVLNLRSLLHLAGLRLCTQAQFEWRAVVAGMVLALRAYESEEHWQKWDAWQFTHIADALKPICYQKGQCGFMAQFDRGCTIRERVEANAKAGRPSSEWGTRLVRDFSSGNFTDPSAQPDIMPIRNEEWAADPMAARRGD